MEKNCNGAVQCFVLFLLISGIAAQFRASFGEPCNRSTRCDSRASLTCQNGICNCSMSEIMTFEDSKCSVLAGEKCTFTTVDLLATDEERSWREDLQCIANSECKDGFCSCLPEFYEAANGTCIMKSDYLGQCEHDLQCKTGDFFVCNVEKNQCQCNATTSRYDMYERQCYKMVGIQCGSDQQACSGYAQCKTDRNTNSKKCECNERYFLNNEKECERKRDYMGPCESDKQCNVDENNSPLVCNTDGQCGCNNETVMSYHQSYGNICTRKAGLQCHDFPYCVQNSECKIIEQNERVLSHFQYCTCKELYFQTSGGTCESKRRYGHSCTLNDQCLNPFVCGTSGTCECDKTKQIYDPSRRKCVGLVSTKCSDSNGCISGAECRHRNTYNDYVCQCKSEFSKSANNTCLAAHGRDCTTEDCNEQQGTICKRGKCVCKYENQQQFIGLKCVSYSDGPCDNNIPCVENANCVEKNGVMQCVCRKGFVSVYGKCHLSVGKPCEYQYNRLAQYSDANPQLTCDILGGLQCIKGSCQCDPLEHYDNNLMRCRGLVGSLCNFDNDEYCTQNAVCRKLTKYSRVGNAGRCGCAPGWVSTSARKCRRNFDLKRDSLKNEIAVEINSTSTTANSLYRND